MVGAQRRRDGRALHAPRRRRRGPALPVGRRPAAIHNGLPGAADHRAHELAPKPPLSTRPRAVHNSPTIHPFCVGKIHSKAVGCVPTKSLRPPKEPMPPEAHQRPGRGDWQTPSTRRQCHQHRRRLGGAGAAWRRVLGPAGSGARRHALPKPSRLARTILMDFTSTMRAASHAHHTCLKPECRDFHQAARCPCVARGEAPGGTSGRILWWSKFGSSRRGGRQPVAAPPMP